MLIYNKKLYLTFRDFNQFYVFQLPEGNEKCFQRLFQVGKETNSYYILGKSGKMYPYDQKQFLKNASDLLMFAISKSYFDSSKIFHIDIEYYLLLVYFFLFFSIFFSSLTKRRSFCVTR